LFFLSSTTTSFLLFHCVTSQLHQNKIMSNFYDYYEIQTCAVSDK
jgi:hypothetical protein